MSCYVWNVSSFEPNTNMQVPNLVSKEDIKEPLALTIFVLGLLYTDYPWIVMLENNNFSVYQWWKISTECFVFLIKLLATNIYSDGPSMFQVARVGPRLSYSSWRQARIFKDEVLVLVQALASQCIISTIIIVICWQVRPIFHHR